jgi:hypothetical protein
MLFSLSAQGPPLVHNSCRPCEKSGVRPFTMYVSRALMDFCCRASNRVPDVAWSSPTGFCHPISCNGGHPSSGHGRHQPCDAENVERPSQIVDERRQAELGADLVEAAHEKGALVHIHCLIVPKGCSTISRRRARTSGRCPSLAAIRSRASRSQGGRPRGNCSCIAGAMGSRGTPWRWRSLPSSCRATDPGGSVSVHACQDKRRRLARRRSETRPCDGADIIVHGLRQQQKLRTFESKNVSHVRF